MIATALAVISAAPVRADGPPRRDEVIAALRKATTFYHGSVASRGGYVYRYSADLSLREGEGTAGEATLWVQPPGTPAVGEAFLDAYEATGDAVHLAAARDAGRCLVLGQLQSGGWFYSIEFDPGRRAAIFYRFGLDGEPLPERVPAKDRARNGGWEVWKRRKYERNVTTLDDDVTQAATRFLIRLDRTLGFEDDAVHEAATYALTSLLSAQYPNGAWSANYDRFQEVPPSETDYPIKAASFPDAWPRTWPKDFTGCYVTNDDLIADLIDTMLLAWEVYRDDRYLASAKRAGDFLRLAQLPEPQPGWAQQYDRDMRPVWSRAFEPPAVSGLESQHVLAALLRLYRATGDDRCLEPVPRAIEYLKRSRLPDGRLARFYEPETNRPIYFTRRDGRHVLTYEDDRIATGYGYVVDSELDAIEAEYRRAKEGRPAAAPRAGDLVGQVRRILAAQDERGAWVEPGRLRHHKADPPGGVIDGATFIANVATLSRYLAAPRE
ncbi:MAG TPA: pectic acid lyase [Planctomycetaceae bacterium]